jgi:hypothetical protein
MWITWLYLKCKLHQVAEDSLFAVVKGWLYVSLILIYVPKEELSLLR